RPSPKLLPLSPENHTPMQTVPKVQEHVSFSVPLAPIDAISNAPFTPRPTPQPFRG
ncbi:hypothetical protein P7K49_037103, partial [Saguinus oedipus]